LTLSFLPSKELPADLQLPSGKFKVSRDPIQLQGATIVISNMKFVSYFGARDQMRGPVGLGDGCHSNVQREKIREDIMRIQNGAILLCLEVSGGEGGIRTPDRAFDPITV
jgi:hypothetical protein